MKNPYGRSLARKGEPARPASIPWVAIFASSSPPPQPPIKLKDKKPLTFRVKKHGLVAAKTKQKQKFFLKFNYLEDIFTIFESFFIILS